MSIKIVAEISCNHTGRYENALKLIKIAKDSGCDFVKFQRFDPELMATDPGPYRNNVTPKEWTPGLFEYARSIDMPIFASVFSLEDVDYIARFKPPYLKIASLENNHFPLIKKAAATRIPLIISTGAMADIDELMELDLWLMTWGSAGVTYLKCTSAYPVRDEIDLGLGAIPLMQSRLPHRKIGFSNHSSNERGLVETLVSTFGIDMIEFHIGLNREDPDAEFSRVGPAQIAQTVTGIRRTEAIIKPVGFKPAENELIELRRALYATADIKENDVFSDFNVAILRGPGGGAHPKFFEKLLGRPSPRSFKKGDPVPYVFQE